MCLIYTVFFMRLKVFLFKQQIQFGNDHFLISLIPTTMNSYGSSGQHINGSPQSELIISNNSASPMIHLQQNETLVRAAQGLVNDNGILIKKNNIKMSSYFQEKQKHLIVKPSERQKFVNDKAGFTKKISSDLKKTQCRSADLHYMNPEQNEGQIGSRFKPQRSVKNQTPIKSQKEFTKELMFQKKVENSLLKSQNLILQKQLAIVKDNAERLNQKYRIDLQYYAEEQQKYKKVIEDIQTQDRQLRKKFDLIEEYRANWELSEASKQNLQKKIEQLENRCKQVHSDYNELFQNYSKLEVKCQGLEKDVQITKNYMDRVQLQLHDKKQQNFRLHSKLMNKLPRSECSADGQERLEPKLEEQQQLMNKANTKTNSLKKKKSELKMKISEVNIEKEGILQDLKAAQLHLSNKDNNIQYLSIESQQLNENIQNLSVNKANRETLSNIISSQKQFKNLILHQCPEQNDYQQIIQEISNQQQKQKQDFSEGSLKAETEDKIWSPNRKELRVLSQSYESICQSIFSFRQKRQFLIRKLYSLMQILIVANEIHNFICARTLSSEIQELQKFIRQDEAFQIKLGAQLRQYSTLFTLLSKQHQTDQVEEVLSDIVN